MYVILRYTSDAFPKNENIYHADGAKKYVLQIPPHPGNISARLRYLTKYLIECNNKAMGVTVAKFGYWDNFLFLSFEVLKNSM